jgi:hypothetical protein
VEAYAVSTFTLGRRIANAVEALIDEKMRDPDGRKGMVGLHPREVLVHLLDQALKTYEPPNQKIPPTPKRKRTPKKKTS